MNPERFWPSCPYPLLATDERLLRVTDAFLRDFLERPELAPVDESCNRERVLHRALLDDPRRPVSEAELAALADPDAIDNYRHALIWRDLLLAHPDLESAYLAVTSGRAGLSPAPVLLDELVQLILCHILEGHDPYHWRAAELLFRRQRVSLDAGVVVADADYLQRRQKPPATTVLESLIRQAGGVAADGEAQPTVELLNKHTLDHYRTHSEAHDLALGLNPGEPGLDALCRVLEVWLGHFHEIAVEITPLREVRDEQWRWHIGLDADSNELLNRLYRGETLDEDDCYRLLALFRMDFADPRPLRPSQRGHPVYLGLAMNPDRELRIKPQNPLLNLPLLEPA